MIFNIRGTSGSGKSHIIHSILDNNAHEKYIEEVNGVSKITSYYATDLLTWIIGNYSNICGGCDGIKSADLVCNKVKKFRRPNLIFEGLLVSHSFQRYHDLANEVGSIVFCFLETKPEVCVERVYARRHAKGKTGRFNEQQIFKDWAAVDRCREKFIDAGHIVYTLDSINSVERFLKIFNKHKDLNNFWEK